MATSEEVDAARLLARDNCAPHRFTYETVSGLVDLFGSPYRAAVAMVHQDIASLAYNGTTGSKSIGDTSISKQYSLNELRGYAEWLEGQAAVMDPLGGGEAIPEGVVFTKVAALFGVGMHDVPGEELSPYEWEYVEDL